MKRTASSFALCVILVLTTSIAVGASDQFKVGGDQGWREPDSNSTDMYARWAGNIRFRVGDSVYFEYNNDSVLVVDKRGYYHCNTTNATAAFNDGKTVVTLDRPGLFYFVSGAPDHCKNGQRLIVDVLARHPPPQQPPSVPPAGTPVTPSTFPGPSQSPLPSAAASSTVSSLLVLVALATLVMSSSV